MHSNVTLSLLNLDGQLHQLSTGSFSCAVNFDKADVLEWSNKLFGLDSLFFVSDVICKLLCSGMQRWAAGLEI